MKASELFDNPIIGVPVRVTDAGVEAYGILVGVHTAGDGSVRHRLHMAEWSEPLTVGSDAAVEPIRPPSPPAMFLPEGLSQLGGRR
ncbi:MAG: hypothetical protein LBK42_01970 [Propionibacteriaceae bacterium]|jgi:hypothetical protein|nr:hypothetical protein [Propionibacteriaceae bacterium]